MVKATVLAIISRMENGEEKILLTKRNIPPFQDQWCLPGGHIDPNEKAKDAIIREVKEEVGLDYTPTFFQCFDEIIPAENIHAVVLAYTGGAQGEIQVDEAEVKDFKWVSVIDALTENLAFEHRSVLKKYMSDPKEETGYLQELNYLRSEILNRFGERNKVLHYMIIFTGIFLGLKVKDFIDPTVLLAFPILGTFLAFLWSHNDLRIYHIGQYIKNHIEPKVKGLNWQNHISHFYRAEIRSAFTRRLQEWSVLGIFLLSYACVIFIALIDFDFEVNAENITVYILLGLDFLFIILTYIFIRQRRSKYNKRGKN